MCVCCKEKVTLPYSRDFVVSPVSGHFLNSRNFVVSPVSRHFLYSRDFVVNPVYYRHFYTQVICCFSRFQTLSIFKGFCYFSQTLLDTFCIQGISLFLLFQDTFCIQGIFRFQRAQMGFYQLRLWRSMFHKLITSYQNHHMNRRLVLETCCEEKNVKSFVKLQVCLEEVR